MQFRDLLNLQSKKEMGNEFLDLGARKKVAKALAQKLIKDSKVNEAPVSLYKVVKYLQATRELEIQKIPIGEKVSGLLVVCKEVDGEYATIGVNANHSWYRRRFTLAHEIGHLLLGHTCNKNEGDGSHNETEANIFAAELLMPKVLIKKDYERLMDIKMLSNLYAVSDQALSIKLIGDRLV